MWDNNAEMCLKLKTQNIVKTHRDPEETNVACRNPSPCSGCLDWRQMMFWEGGRDVGGMSADFCWAPPPLASPSGLLGPSPQLPALGKEKKKQESRISPPCGCMPLPANQVSGYIHVCPDSYNLYGGCLCHILRNSLKVFLSYRVHEKRSDGQPRNIMLLDTQRP